MAREGQGYPCCQHDMMMMMMIFLKVHTNFVVSFRYESLLDDTNICIVINETRVKDRVKDINCYKETLKVSIMVDERSKQRLRFFLPTIAFALGGLSSLDPNL